MFKFVYENERDNFDIKASIPVQTGIVTGLYGTDSRASHVLGRIVAGQVPIEQDGWDQLEQTTSEYKGTLTVKQDSRPNKKFFVSNNPDNELFFSRPYEEINARRPECSPSDALIREFDLCRIINERRKTETLSGGEKMRLALVIAFGHNANLYVLDDVFPWLDTKFREILTSYIESTKQNHSFVIISYEKDVIYDLSDVTKRLKIQNNSLLNSTNTKGRTQSANIHKKISDTLNQRQSHVGELLIELDNATIVGGTPSFGRPGGFEVNNIDLQLRYGDSCLIVGKNGSGKSTLVRSILRSGATIKSGSLKLWGEKIQEIDREALSNRIGYLSQFPDHQLYGSSVKEILYRNNQNSKSRRLIEQYIPTMNTPILNLNTIQKKVVALFSRLTNDTDIIILDEPTWGISYDKRNKLINDILDFAIQYNSSILMVTHDDRMSGYFSGQVLSLD